MAGVIQVHVAKTVGRTLVRQFDQRPAGFSIIELMVSIALTLVLLAGVAAIFSGARASYATTDRLSQIQETGRRALDELLSNIRAAGFGGCVYDAQYVGSALNDNTALASDFLSAPVRGYQYIGAGRFDPALDLPIASRVAQGSDVLVVRSPKRNSRPLQLQTNMEKATDPLHVSSASSSQLRSGDIAMAYNCEAKVYFHVTSFVDGRIEHAASDEPTAFGNAADSLDYLFDAGAEVLPMQTSIYYIAASASEGADTQSLWRQIGNNKPQEFVQGVEQMQLQFALDSKFSNGVNDDYVTAEDVQDWNAVTGVAVALLVSSFDKSTQMTHRKTFQLLDVEVPNTSDGRSRDVFSTAAAIRNRVGLEIRESSSDILL